MGTVLYAADFANIEGRTLAWLAGETWKLKAFRAFDEGTGPDLYKVTAAGTYGIPIEKVTKSQRQVGKVQELALGYEGGVNAFASMAAVYGLKESTLAAIYPTLLESSPPGRIAKATEAYEDRGQGHAFGREAWLACELAKRAWRERHPATCEFWRDLNAAAVQAVAAPGDIVAAGPIAYRKHGGHLWCRLPSGRDLCYPFAEIHSALMPWRHHTTGLPVRKPAVRYYAVDQRTRKWGRKAAYGGLLAENVTQAVARDVMADAIKRVDAAGYPVVLSVHDEVVSERSGGDLEEFVGLMSVLPTWAAGLPVAAEGWTGFRYRK